MSRVALYQADRTNQKLYFARLACQHALQVADNVQAAQGAREAAVFHLHGAVLAYLQELARYYKIVGEPTPSLASLKQRMADRTQVSPEIIILENLSRDGFLAELNRAYLSCQFAPEPPEPTHDEESSSNLIIKVTQSPLAWLPDVQILREWHKALRDLIEGFRNEMIEF